MLPLHQGGFRHLTPSFTARLLLPFSLSSILLRLELDLRERASLTDPFGRHLVCCALPDRNGVAFNKYMAVELHRPWATRRECSERPLHNTSALYSGPPMPDFVTQTQPLALVLDIDKTLIDAKDHDTVIVKRPHVDAFLDYCFANCAAVALWTNASSDWAAAVVDNLRTADGDVRPWAFVWSCDRGVQKLDWNTPTYPHFRRHVIKPLKKVWKSRGRKAQGFTHARTLIIDDTPSNCQCNYGNAIYCPPFYWNLSDGDDVLLRLQSYLGSLQADPDAADVRTVDKRGWYVDAGDLPGGDARD